MCPDISLDASTAKVFETVPEGTYQAEIVEVQDVQAGPKAQYVPVVFQITDGEHEGAKLWRNCPIEGDGAGILLDLYNKALGDELETGTKHKINTDDLVGAQVRVVVKHEQYQGETRSNISRVLSI